MSEERGVRFLPTAFHPFLERELTELACYHCGLFAGAVSRLDSAGDHAAVVAHGLWLLAREAERRRQEWLGSSEAFSAAIAL